MIDIKSIEMTSVDLYEYAKSRRLVPEGATEAVQLFRSIAASGVFYELVEDDVRLGIIAISPAGYGIKNIDIIPESKKMTQERLQQAGDVVGQMAGAMLSNGTRRLTASVPVTRRKTIKILAAAGFRREGTMRLAWMAADRKPEDVQVLGMLSGDLKEE